MLDIAWPELLVIGAVALVAIGPKDLPKVMRALGRWAGKAQRVMRELRGQFDQLSYEAEVAEKLRRDAARASAEAPRPSSPQAGEGPSGPES